MKLYLALCSCFLVTFTEATEKILLKREQLLSKIGNWEMIKGKENSLLNVPDGDVYEEYFARDCRAAYLNGRRQSGLYVVRPQNSPLIAVYCEMNQTEADWTGLKNQTKGGWTVLMKNTASQKTAWDREWAEYKNGFGDLADNHWLGNEFIHLLTKQNAFTVRFVLVTAGGKKIYADYHSFELDSEAKGYALRLGNYLGTVTDALTFMYETGIHDNMKFSTKDNDQDRRVPDNCALKHGGGWWYDNCYSALLNSAQGIYWEDVCTDETPCEAAYMMIIPNGKNCNKH